MPGVRGGAVRPGGGGGSYASDMLGGMFNPESYQVDRGKYNFSEMGGRPPKMSDRMIGLQRNCAAGDGRACNELKIATIQHQDTIRKWEEAQAKRQQRSRGGGMVGAR